jgi:GNAT superfamily N-acetyltransferase
MFKIKPMKPEDFVFAAELANTMDWNMAIEDFQFMASLEPGGCFILFDDSEPIGIATCNSYGKIGWFGNLIVKKDYRGKSAGSQLVKHAINYLHGKGVETIGLYAYPSLIKFYGNLGFRHDEDFSVLKSAALKAISAEGLTTVGKRNMKKIAELDRTCFGGDRRKLLESIILKRGNLSYCVSSDEEVTGYIAATVYETMAWVGPLVCQPDKVAVAVTLLKGVLSELTGLCAYVVLPKKELALVNALSTAGFKEDFSVVRMFFGPNAARNCIYLAESLERG